MINIAWVGPPQGRDYVRIARSLERYGVKVTRQFPHKLTSGANLTPDIAAIAIGAQASGRTRDEARAVAQERGIPTVVGHNEAGKIAQYLTEAGVDLQPVATEATKAPDEVEPVSYDVWPPKDAVRAMLGVPQGRPVPTTIYVTPEVAAVYLSHNPNNRTMSPTRVKAYVREINSGQWKQTHQGIAFGWDGNLIDGQHRLAAIIETAKAQWMMVSWNLDPKAYDAVDTPNMGRSPADLFSRRIPEARNKNVIVACGSHMLRGIAHATLKVTPSEAAAFAEENYDLIRTFTEALRRGSSRAVVGRAAVSAAFANAVRSPDGKTGGWGSRDLTMVTYLATQLAANDWQGEGDPMKVLFDRFLREHTGKTSGRAGLDDKTMYALTVSALRNALNDNRVKTITATDIEWGAPNDIVRKGTGTIRRKSDGAVIG